MKKTILSILMIASLLLGATGLRAHTVTLSFDPTTQDVILGSPVDVALIISGLGNGNAPSISTFDLDVSFNPRNLSFSSAVFGDPTLGDQLDIFDMGGNPMFAGLMEAGKLNLFELSLDLPAVLNAKQADSFTLVTLTFNTLLAPRSSSLGLSINSLGDAFGNPISATVSDGNITVVPIPGTIWLIGSALVGMLGSARRRKA